MGTIQRPCFYCSDDILPHQVEHAVFCAHCTAPLHHNCERPHILKEHPSRPVDRPPPADRPPQPLACCAMLPTGRMKLLGAKPSREDRGRAEERIALQLAAAESQPSGEGTPCAEEKKADSAAIVASKRQHTLPTPPHAESLRLDLCHGCALDAAGIDDDGSTVAENYLKRRRGAFNTTTSSDYVQTDPKERRWRPGLNELGFTMCSACGRDGERRNPQDGDI